MKSIELIKVAMQISDQATIGLIEDMRDAPFTQPTATGGNHPMWVLGHIAFIEAGLPSVLYGEPHPLAHWASLFAAGSEPTADPKAYPPFDEVLKVYRESRARNLKLLNQFSETELTRPTKAPPPGLEKVLCTFGQSYLVIALHQMSHMGQVADARRVAGRRPMFTPGDN